MQIVSNDEGLLKYLKSAVAVNEDQPVLIDQYIVGKELEVDAVCDGTDVFVPGIMAVSYTHLFPPPIAPGVPTML